MATYSPAFDALFHAEQMHILQTAPRATTDERALRACHPETLRHELCDRVLVLHEAHARQLLATYQRHYNSHRLHQARNQRPPASDRQPTTVQHPQTHRLQRTRILGGLINEYRNAA